jgi:DNA-binding transcriptional MerR regulator
MLAKADLEKLYNSGLSIREIAKEKGLPYSMVRYWFEKHGIKRRSRQEACYYGYWNKHSKGSTVFPYRKSKKVCIEKIRKFYYKEKMSVPEMADKFDSSIWSIYRQMKKNGLERRDDAEAKKLAFNKKPLSFNPKKNLSFGEQELKIAGIMLYWAEGSKIKKQEEVVCGKTVDFANSDPKMIQLFLKFLRKICRVDEERLRIYLYCYANQDVTFLKNYWSEITKIPLNHFTKPYVRKEFSREKIGRMKYGLVHVRYSDKKLLLQIHDWIEEYLVKIKI